MINVPAVPILLFHEAIAARPAAHPLRGTVRYCQAQVYEFTGESDRAIAELTRALAGMPGFPEHEASKELVEATVAFLSEFGGARQGPGAAAERARRRASER